MFLPPDTLPRQIEIGISGNEFQPRIGVNCHRPGLRRLNSEMLCGILKKSCYFNAFF